MDTGNLNNDHGLLASLVHEQIHWFVADERGNEEKKAIAELKEIFPEVPVGKGQGARDEYSTYLHLIVCYMEHEAMKELVGEEKAREIMESWRHYKWIYKAVLSESNKIKPIIDKYRFII